MRAEGNPSVPGSLGDEWSVRRGPWSALTCPGYVLLVLYSSFGCVIGRGACGRRRRSWEANVDGASEWASPAK